MFSDNLVGHSGEVAVLASLMLLVIVGGIDFPLVVDVVNTRWHFGRWSNHTRLTLATMVALLVVSSAGETVLE